MARFELAAWGPGPYGYILCERISELGPSEFLENFSAPKAWGSLDIKNLDDKPGHEFTESYEENEWILLWNSELGIVGLVKDNTKSK